MSKMNKQKCKAQEGCDANARSQGYCAKHYARVKSYGRDYVIINPAGKGTIHSEGYRQLSINGKLVLEHVYLAEKALGRPLPPGAEVHHMNENRLDNYTPLNLIICPGRAYHMLLHKRTRELFSVVVDINADELGL